MLKTAVRITKAMLIEEQAAVLVEYALTLSLFTPLVFAGLMAIASLCHNLYLQDAQRMAHLSYEATFPSVAPQ